MEIIIASNNKHKIREIRQVLDNSIKLISLSESGITDDIPENEGTIEGNALEKARYVHQMTGSNVFADDTGLEVEALSGAPGVHSARYAGESKDPVKNIEKLLYELKGCGNRKARFRTVIALICETGEFTFEGIISGHITEEIRGNKGFGYDPVFIPENQIKTFAEMTADEKNKISHRSVAIKKLDSFLRETYGQ